MWEAITILLLVLALLFFIQRPKKVEPTDKSPVPARLPDPTVNPFSPPAPDKPVLGNDPAIPSLAMGSVTASWAGGRRPIRRPDQSGNPGGGRVAITMPLIRWAQARYDAYHRGVGDVPTYNQAVGVLYHVRQGGWFLVGSPIGTPEAWERYDPIDLDLTPVRADVVPGDRLFERGHATAATILRSEI